MSSTIITIEVTGNEFQKKAKQKALQELSNLDVDVLEKVAELSKSPKAVQTLRNPPPLLKMALGIK